MNVALIVTGALVLSSCSRSETHPSALQVATAPDGAPAPPAVMAAGPSVPSSRGPVSAMCGATPCRDYQTAAARIRTLATPGKGPGCSEASIGSCGATRYTQFSDGFSAREEYFDDGGAMIAVYTRADIDPAGGWYGPAQSCEKVPDVVLCRGGYLDAGPR